MHPNLIAYAAAREALLRRVAASLEADERVVAAWLSGSLSRDGGGHADSDIDLDVVLTDAAAVALCRRSRVVAGETTPERLAFFARFGRPVLVHVNHHNALDGGTFTAVFYAEGAPSIDWRQVPLARARRPLPSRLLFARTPIPAASPTQGKAAIGDVRRRLEALAPAAEACGARVPGGAGAIVAARLALTGEPDSSPLTP